MLEVIVDAAARRLDNGGLRQPRALSSTVTVLEPQSVQRSAAVLAVLVVDVENPDAGYRAGDDTDVCERIFAEHLLDDGRVIGRAALAAGVFLGEFRQFRTSHDGIYVPAEADIP